MAQTFGNPYQPATAIGSGLQNIALGLFGGRRGSTRDPALDAAHAGLYDEQTKAKAVERQLNERLLADQGGDAQDELIAAQVGLPVHSVKGYRRALQSGGNLEEYAPYADKLGDAMVAIRGGYADKSINPANISKALLELKQRRDRDAVLANPALAGNTSKAYLSTEGKPLFDNSAVGTFDLSTGVEKLNPYGTEKVTTEKKHGKAYDAAAGASGAAARASGALADQRNIENKAGVKIGAPVFVDDGKGGTTFASPIEAVAGGSKAAPRPTAPRQTWRAVYNKETGETTYEPLVEGAHQQPGALPRAATVRAPRKLTPNDKKAIESSIGEALMGLELDAADLDPATRKAIIQQAEIEFAGGAAGHLNAVQDAINKVAPDSFEQTGIYGFRKLTAKGGPRAVEKPVPGAMPGAPRPAAAPAAAPAPTPAAAPKPAAAAAPAKASPQQLIDDANKAIAAGANPEAVKKRLREMGVETK